MKKLFFTYDPAPLEQNPALQAWYTIAGSAAVPAAIDCFIGEHDRSRLYRFREIRGWPHAVIAKAAAPESLWKEHHIYTRVLPRLPLDRLTCYGISGTDESGTCWLFLEEATGLSYEENNPLHTDLVSAWLGTYHAATSTQGGDFPFPRLHFNGYRDTLHGAHGRLRPFRKDPALTTALDQLLGRLEGHLEVLDAGWEQIAPCASVVPECLAHLDFVKKNVKIDFSGIHPRVQVMDWGSSRYGIPVKDMAGLNMGVYRSATASYGLDLTASELDAAAQVGAIVKYILYLHEELDNPYLLSRRKSIENLRAYERAFSSLRTIMEMI